MFKKFIVLVASIAILFLAHFKDSIINAQIVPQPTVSSTLVSGGGSLTSPAVTIGSWSLYQNGVFLVFANGGANQLAMYAANSLNLGTSGALSWASTSDATSGADTFVQKSSADVVTFLKAKIPSKVFVTSNFTTPGNTNLNLITGLSWTVPTNTSANYHFDCFGEYSIATAAVAVDFGIQDVSIAPTNALITGKQWIATGSASPTVGVLTAFASTTATSVTSATPGATATVYEWEMHGLVEHPSNATPSVFQVMVKTATSADVVTVYRGSYCTAF